MIMEQKSAADRVALPVWPINFVSISRRRQLRLMPSIGPLLLLRLFPPSKYALLPNDGPCDGFNSFNWPNICVGLLFVQRCAKRAAVLVCVLDWTFVAVMREDLHECAPTPMFAQCANGLFAKDRAVFGQEMGSA